MPDKTGYITTFYQLNIDTRSLSEHLTDMIILMQLLNSSLGKLVLNIEGFCIKGYMYKANVCYHTYLIFEVQNIFIIEDETCSKIAFISCGSKFTWWYYFGQVWYESWSDSSRHSIYCHTGFSHWVRNIHLVTSVYSLHVGGLLMCNVYMILSFIFIFFK